MRLPLNFWARRTTVPAFVVALSIVETAAAFPELNLVGLVPSSSAYVLIKPTASCRGLKMWRHRFRLKIG